MNTVLTSVLGIILSANLMVIVNSAGLEYLANYVCKDGIIDAATRTEDGSTYLFRDDYYWKIIKQGVAFGYPKLISVDWMGVHGRVDAAVTWNDGSTFIFKRDQYWRFFNKEADHGYPKFIKDGFPSLPDNLDAAFVWEPNGKTYFFKGDYYWVFDQRLETPIPPGYPRLIKDHWIGVPNNVEAAIRWNGGKTYFFKSSGYYRFDESENQVVRGYPWSTSQEWFLCHNITTDDVERERFGRIKAPSSNSNSCSCSCTQPPVENENSMLGELRAEMENIKNGIQDVQKTLRTIQSKQEIERPRRINDEHSLLRPNTPDFSFNVNNIPEFMEDGRHDLGIPMDRLAVERPQDGQQFDDTGNIDTHTLK